jgi:hypothetical protein
MRRFPPAARAVAVLFAAALAAGCSNGSQREAEGVVGDGLPESVKAYIEAVNADNAYALSQVVAPPAIVLEGDEGEGGGEEPAPGAGGSIPEVCLTAEIASYGGRSIDPKTSYAREFTGDKDDDAASGEAYTAMFAVGEEFVGRRVVHAGDDLKVVLADSLECQRAVGELD